METVRLSSKGQIVIPKAIRDQLHLQAGSELFVSASALGVSLVPVQAFPATTPAALRGALAKAGRKLPDDEAIKARIKSRLKARNAP
jgi:AbrB family looped-hinge helix DNA binding protein